MSMPLRARYFVHGVVTLAFIGLLIAFIVRIAIIKQAQQEEKEKEKEKEKEAALVVAESEVKLQQSQKLYIARSYI
jgi:hypothetical protein